MQLIEHWCNMAKFALHKDNIQHLHCLYQTLHSHSYTINITHVTIITCTAYNNYMYYNTIRLTKVPLVCLQGLFIYLFFYCYLCNNVIV